MRVPMHKSESERWGQKTISYFIEQAHLRIAIFALIVGMMCLITACIPPPPGAGIQWTNYPNLARTPVVYKWLVVECQLSGVPTIPAGLDTNIRQFLGLSGAGYGNIVDYFHDISYNNAAFVTQFIDWVPAPFSLTDIADVRTPVGGNMKRAERVRECLEAIPPNQAPDFGDYYGVIAVSNVGPADASACGVGQLPMTINNQIYNLGCVWLDANSLGIAFAAHEISHAFGLDHSFDDSNAACGGKPGEYCDPWDMMSAMNTYQFIDQNWLIGGNSTSSGPGMSTPNLWRMGWIPTNNQRTFEAEDDEQTFTIRSLSHAQEGAPLMVFLHVGGVGPFDGIYTVEYRQGDGWDIGFVTRSDLPPGVQSNGGAVLVHQFRQAGEPATTLIEGANKGALLPGNTLVLINPAGPVYHITVNSIDRTNGTATVSIGHGRKVP